MNKNTKAIRAAIAKASRSGKLEVTVSVPVPNYHSNSALVTKKFPCAVPNGAGVISTNPRRNTQMVVSKNVDNHGKAFSLTSHEVISEDNHVLYKNHEYLKGEYKQPIRFRAAGE